MRAVDLRFTFGRAPDRRAVLLRHHEPWPRHVVIGDDFLDWADDSAWVQRDADGAVWFRPTDAAPARYRPSHVEVATGDRHYDLSAVGDPPRLVT